MPWDAHSRLESSSYTVRTRKEYVAKNKREGIHALIADGWYTELSLIHI